MEVIMDKSYFKAGIDPSAARREMFKTSDGQRIESFPKKKYTGTADGIEFTVNIKLEPEVKVPWRVIQNTAGYDPEASVPHILSRMEAYALEDPNFTADGFLYAEEQLDVRNVVTLEVEEMLDRYAWFLKVCRYIFEDSNLEFLIGLVPKKKNGTLHKGRVTLIASLPIVFGKMMEYYVLAAKSKSDTDIDISIMQRTFSKELWNNVKKTEFIKHIASDNYFQSQHPTDAEKEPLPTIKMWLYDVETSSVDIPVITLDDGRYALDVNPRRALCDFACLKGSDQNGYAIYFPANPPDRHIPSRGLDINVVFRVDTGSRFRSLFYDIRKYLQFFQCPDEETEHYAKWFIGCDETGQLTVDAIGEPMYLLLTGIEDVTNALDDNSLIERGVETAKLKKNGALNCGNGAFNKIMIPSSVQRQTPFISCGLEFENIGPETIAVREYLLKNTAE